MKFRKSIQTVDLHTMGEPIRIITGGIPYIPGKTISEKKTYFKNNMDHIRTGIMLEPRGHKDMFGSIITEPINKEADLGIIFMDGGGYLNMCGHGTIGAVTAALETGMIEMDEPYTEVVLETPVGLIRTKARVENKKVKHVSFKNVLGFHYKKDIKIEVPELKKKVKLDISFGGSFFAIISAKELGIRVEAKNTQYLVEIALSIRDIINNTIEISHPTLEDIKTVDLIEIYDVPSHPEADYKNMVIFGQGQVDRSPCGTGTCAKLATLYSKGEIKEGESFVHESILGTLFTGKILGTTKVGDYKAIIPEITGAAYITGFNNFMFDDEDPVKYGFVIQSA